MRGLHLDDSAPGARIETRRVPNGAVVLVIRIAGPALVPAPRLLVRWEPDGQVFVALDTAE